MNRQSVSQSPLGNPAALPLRTVNSLTSSVLVVAPHPDDETLGCGGAIALLRALGYPVHILVISDGTLSHPRSLKYPAARLQALRESETLEALSILGVRAATTFLRLKDGSIPTAECYEFQEATSRCRTCLEQLLPETILVPWRSDPHADHRATWKLIHTAVAELNDSPRIIEYPIWDWDPTQQGESTNFEPVVGWRLDIRAVLETKLKAIAAYRSQITNLIDDDPEGFQLTPAMLANFSRPWEVYLEAVP